MKIKAIKVVSFIFIFLVIFYYINKVLKPKYVDGIYSSKIFYKQKKNSIDVLFFGTSHVHMDVSQAVLYKNYGIASYTFASGGQCLWDTYYYIIEALKTQTPKLIVIEGFRFSYNKDFINNKEIFIKTTLGINPSVNKLNLIKTTTTKNEFIEYINPLNLYHSRYSSLNRKDFLKYQGLSNKFIFYKGYNLLLRTYALKEPNIKNIKDIVNLSPKVNYFYKKIIDLAKENNIPILVTINPFSLNDYHQKRYNSAQAISERYNVDFVNFNLNYDDYNLDFSKDFNDAGHLNYKGAAKFTRYLGKYLVDHYDLPDRRGDPKYYSWEINAKHEYKSIYNFELTNLANLNEYIEKVKNADDYIIAVTMLGNYQSNDAVVQNIYTNLNINDIYLKNASYVLDNNKLIYSSAGTNQYLFYDEIGNYTDLVVDSGRKLSINRTNYIKTTNGLNMVIYDKFSEEIVDNIYLEYKENSIDTTIKR